MPNWLCISTTYTAASLEFSGGDKNTSVPKNKALGDMIKPLLLSSGAGHLQSEILRAMIEKGVVQTYVDHYVSPYFGPKTSRLNLVFPKMLVTPVEFQIIPQRALIQAVGKRSNTGERKYISDIRMDMVLTEIKGDSIPQLLSTNKKWFCGELPITYDTSVSIKKAK